MMILSTTTLLLVVLGLTVDATAMENYVAACETPGEGCSDDVIAAIVEQGGLNIESFPEAAMITFDAETPVGGIPDVIIVPNIETILDPLAVVSDESLSVDDECEDCRHLLQGGGGGGYAPNSGEDDSFFDLQWFHEAVGSRAAWEQGIRGQGVKVAVLDGGIQRNHADLAENLDVESSTSFVPGEAWDGVDKYDSHGSHVAGIIGAADNGIGVIGVAPEANLVSIKVLRESGGGRFSWLIKGIYYAAYLGVDVINMSLGALIDTEDLDSEYVADFRNMVCRAAKYATQKRVTVIASAGNDGIKLKGSTNRVFLRLMSDCPSVIAISAAGPFGWAVDPQNADLYTPASYSTYGTKVDFAGPGGSSEYLADDPTSFCTMKGITRQCGRFDSVLSTGGTNYIYYWSRGTSMAAPAASGVAALIISENGGKMKPAQVSAQLAKRAIKNLGGKKGEDIFYGRGHVHSGYYLD